MQADQVKERPILFSAPMILALLAGAKTQTRRMVKLPHENPLGKWEPTTFGGPDGGMTRDGKTLPLRTAIWHTRTGDSISAPWLVGERLWVRESTHRTPMLNILTGEPLAPIYDVGAYSADNEPVVNEHGFDFGWWYSKKSCPSIHMPRWASRILLEITEVRVERLQDISQADARAEGAPPSVPSIDKISREFGYEDFPRSWYAQLWDQINGPGSWDANPWVWAVSFRRLKP